MCIKVFTQNFFVLVLLVLLFFSQTVFPQNRYEVEALRNPNPGKKDTREVNAVLIFENDRVKIQSRRSKEVFKEFRFADIRSVEHSYSKKPVFSPAMAAAIALTVITLLPVFLFTIKKDKHWLTIVAGEDFAVLKIENDNYKLIRTEFIARNIGISDVDEGKR